MKMGFSFGFVRRAAVLAAALSVGACAGYDAFVDPDAAEQIVGTWSWVESTGGIAGMRYAPGQQHPAVRFVFATDGTLSVIRGDESADTVEYQAVPVEGGEIEIRYPDGLAVFAFDPQVEAQIARIGKADTLVLADPCCDRYSHTFVRQR